MTETMKNMDPEQMKKMMEMSQKLAGKGIGPGSTASCFWVRPLVLKYKLPQSGPRMYHDWTMTLPMADDWTKSGP